MTDSSPGPADTTGTRGVTLAELGS
jgi:hypothetical protein